MAQWRFLLSHTWGVPTHRAAKLGVKCLSDWYSSLDNTWSSRLFKSAFDILRFNTLASSTQSNRGSSKWNSKVQKGNKTILHTILNKVMVRSAILCWFRFLWKADTSQSIWLLTSECNVSGNRSLFRRRLWMRIDRKHVFCEQTKAKMHPTTGIIELAVFKLIITACSNHTWRKRTWTIRFEILEETRAAKRPLEEPQMR